MTKMIDMTMPLAISKRCALSRSIMPFRISCRPSIATPSRDQTLPSDLWVYNTFGRSSKSMIMAFFLLAYLLLLSLHVPVLYAQEIYYVNSPDVDLNVRHGPGTEHGVVTRLPHGTP